MGEHVGQCVLRIHLWYAVMVLFIDGCRGGDDRHVYLHSRVVTHGDAREAAVLAYSTAAAAHFVVKLADGVEGVEEALQGIAVEGSRPHFVPHGSYIVYTTAARLQDLKESERYADRILWTARLRSTDKVDAATLSQAQTPAARRDYVVLVEGSAGAFLKTALSGAGWHCSSHVIPIPEGYPFAKVAVSCAGVTERTVLHIASHSAVAFVHEKETPAPFADLTAVAMVQSGTPTHLKIWDAGFRGEGEIVAVGDTGVDHASCFFTDAANPIALYPNVSLSHRKILSISQSDCECTERGAAANGQPAVMGDYEDNVEGHGTHAAGLIAGDAGSLSAQAGVAPKAKLFVQDLQDPSLSTTYLRRVFPGYSLLAKYLPDAYNMKAKVQSSSWGTSPAAGPDDAVGEGGLGPRFSTVYSSHAHEIDFFTWTNKDFLPVFAAGNDGRRGARTIATPANAKNTLTVGAQEVLLQGTAKDDVAYFSSQGPTADGRLKPEVVAPGTSVHAAYSDGNGPNTECRVTAHSGTSVAAPLVAGAAALVRQFLRVANKGAMDSASADLVKGILIASTDLLHGVKKQDFDDPIGKQINTTWPSWTAGYGSVNLDNVLHPHPTPLKQMWYAEERFLHHAADAMMTYCFSVPEIASGTHSVRVVLSWVDYPAAIFAAKALVSDLDLIVFNDLGETWRGNADMHNITDTVNNVEAVRINNPLPGRYQVHVVLRNVLIDAVKADGGQPFALVVSGAVSENSGVHCPVRNCPSSCSGTGNCGQTNGVVAGLQTNFKRCTCPTGYVHADCSVPPCRYVTQKIIQNHTRVSTVETHSARTTGATIPPARPAPALETP